MYLVLFYFVYLQIFGLVNRKISLTLKHYYRKGVLSGVRAGFGFTIQTHSYGFFIDHYESKFF
jgi:hypothetical protein